MYECGCVNVGVCERESTVGGEGGTSFKDRACVRSRGFLVSVGENGRSGVLCD